MSKQKIVGTYKGLIHGAAEHEYLEIDFYESASCQIIGSFHRCAYKMEFKADAKTVELRNFC